MRRPRTEGVYSQLDGSLIIIYPSSETRDGIRTITLPAPAMKVLKQYWGVLIKTSNEETAEPLLQEETPRHRRTDSALAIIGERPGLSGGAFASELIYRIGEDEEDQKIRNKSLGFLNELAERGLVFRDEEDRFWPIDHERTNSAK